MRQMEPSNTSEHHFPYRLTSGPRYPQGLSADDSKMFPLHRVMPAGTEKHVLQEDRCSCV